jgi:type II secretory pathway pseudopilin PulG
MTKGMRPGSSLPFRASSFVINSSFVIRISSFQKAFTILELLVVISVIIIVAGLILATQGYVHKKRARATAEVEIAAMSAACESYRADNGGYPTDPATTEVLDARTSTNPVSYQASSLFLFKQLSGLDAAQAPVAGAKSYFTFNPQMLGGARDASGKVPAVAYIRDPFGNSYGYSTIKAANPAATGGYNPTFDLWSTGGTTGGTDQSQWITNW